MKKKRKLRRLKIGKREENQLLDLYQRKLIEALKELRLPVLMLHFALTVGTLGYMVLSGGDFINSFYMTVITIGTIGFGEIVEGSDTLVGRIFTSFLALSGIGIFTTSVTITVRLIFKEDIINLYRAIRMLKEIENLSNHFIVCGYNEITARLIKLLRKRKIEFVVIDGRSEVAVRLQEDNVKYFVLEEPFKRSVLISAGIMKAKGLIVNLEDDARNIAVIVTARLLRPERDNFLIYSFAPTEETAQKLEELGANRAIVPARLLATRISAYIFHIGSAFISDLFDRIAFGEESDIDILEFGVSGGSPLVGKMLKEIDFRRKLSVTIIAIRRTTGELDINITGDTQIEEGDTLILFGSPKNLRRAQRILGNFERVERLLGGKVEV